jgi:cytochrome b involved in lipid metabolism
LRPLVSNPDQIQYTLEQVAEHASETDNWTIYENRIYDVTKYARIHPGGFAKIMLGAGKDCTELFKKYHAYINCHHML